MTITINMPTKIRGPLLLKWVATSSIRNRGKGIMDNNPNTVNLTPRDAEVLSLNLERASEFLFMFSRFFESTEGNSLAENLRISKGVLSVAMKKQRERK